MNVSVNEQVLNKLADGITTWEMKKARSETEGWEYNRFEEAMDEYEDVLSWATDEYGMRKIGEGRDRMAFTSGTAVSADVNVVVKMSRSDGTAQNAEEVELWKQLDEEAREHVVPIITWADDYSWLVQRRVSQGSPPGSSKIVAERLAEAGWTCSDIRPDNVGVIDGEPVLMDLGIGLREL